MRSAFLYDPNINYSGYTDIQIGKMNKVCNKCKAKKWSDEPNGLCCAAGKVVLLDIPESPKLIKDLLLGNHPFSAHFLNNIRRYNTLFQMTSFGANKIKEGHFMPTFRVQGQIYHLIGSLLPPEGKDPQYLQIYFLSDEDQIRVRSNILPNLNVELIGQLQAILQKNNRYIQDFKSNLDNNLKSDDLKIIIHADRRPVNEHRGRYNAPTANEVAVLLVNEDKGPRDIVLHCRDGLLKRVSELHRSYDSLQYPLIFIKGEDGYCLNIPQQNSPRNKTVTCMQFYAYRIMIKQNSFNTLHHFRNLFNQYCVDMMAKIITERLDYIRRNQTKLRSENYIHLRDAVNQDQNINAQDIGQYVILPSTFTGSPRYMHEKTQDAMTYIRNFGRPDLFITFTCNPEWPEIKAELFPGQRSYDRHDIIARVFNLKVKSLMKLLTKNSIFGDTKAFIFSVEWQKRGLPHVHILLWLQTKIQPDEIDCLISAELPDQDHDPILHDIVMKNMIHGPCGKYNMSAPCMINGICTKRYPRNFIDETQSGEDGYPVYRRKSPNIGGNKIILKVRGRMLTIDNKWVVPYSPILCRSFNAHINVEYCHSVKAIKYICKYINKGSDQATISVGKTHNEIETYLNGRYISTSEAVWRILEFHIHERHPTVTHLAVHLENGERVYFTQNNLLQRAKTPPATTLTAFFELCRKDDFAKTLLYIEVPAYYTWANNKFSRRKKGECVEGFPNIKKDSALGRMYCIHPSQCECFHLRILLHHVRGPTSFINLRTVHGKIMPTYQLACKELGLIENDEHWNHTLADAVLSDSPNKLRELFVTILLFCAPSDPLKLWEIFNKHLCEDIHHRVREQRNNMSIPYSDDILNEGLIQIEDKLFELSEKTLADFALPSPVREATLIDSLRRPSKQPYERLQLDNFVCTNLPNLVPDQRHVYDVIVDSVDKNKGKLLFIDAPGGTGKTFLINIILAKIRSTGKLAIAVASSGIAATLLSGGKTAHSTFKLPLNVPFQQDSVCSIRKNGPLGKMFKEASLIMWDECTMCHRSHIEAVDRSLRDIRNSDRAMGGITFVFAGDFRQTLPVIPRGTRADIIKACLKSSHLWKSIESLTLRTNMRAHLGGGDSSFSSRLLQLGDGNIPDKDGIIEIGDQLGRSVATLDELICKVYPDIETIFEKDYTWVCERTIISARNSSVDQINEEILKRVPGDEKCYKSIDTVINEEDTVHYPQEFLNTLNPSGLPSHFLKIKVGIPIILMRNLNPPNLCNGTRLQVKALRNNIIETVILTGPAAGQMAHIPRIPMIPTDLPFPFKRLQFPVKLSFAITINKSQGQTYKYVGIDLRQECFSHGQLYVGLSRSGSADNQYIMNNSRNNTKNVVYSEIFK